MAYFIYFINNSLTIQRTGFLTVLYCSQLYGHHACMWIQLSEHTKGFQKLLSVYLLFTLDTVIFLFFFFIFHKNFIIFIKKSLKLALQKWRVFFIYLFYLSTCQNPPWSILLATELEQYIGHCFCSVGHSSCCTVILLQRNQHFILQVHKTVVASKQFLVLKLLL